MFVENLKEMGCASLCLENSDIVPHDYVGPMWADHISGSQRKVDKKETERR